MRTLAAVLLLLTAAAPLSAQVELGIASPDLLWWGSQRRPKAAAPPAALALDLALGASVWAEVRVSTAGPVAELTRLAAQGFYKLELIETVLLSARGRRPLRETAERRRKGEALEAIALDYRLDYDKIHEAALAVAEIVDREYLPLFPERRLTRRQEEGP